MLKELYQTPWVVYVPWRLFSLTGVLDIVGRRRGGGLFSLTGILDIVGWWGGGYSH